MLARVGAVIAGLALAGCASVVGDTDSTVQVRTNPAGAHCTLTGQDGFSAQVVSPAAVTIPNVASPVTVACAAPGFRPSSHTLSATSDGWVWGNGALIFGTAGVMVLGAVIDEVRGAGKSYADEVEYTLSPDHPRPVMVRDRSTGRNDTLEAR